MATKQDERGIGKLALSEEDKAFYQGFAVAVGTLARNGYPSLAKDIMNCNGVTIERLKESGVEKEVSDGGR